MPLICPNCEAKIPAEHINIQRLVAVCPACDIVFEFGPPASKSKRRKVKQPEHLMLREAETLLMTFRTNFRLDKNEAFLTGSIMGVVFTFVTIMIFNKYLIDDIPLVMPIIFGLGTLLCYYWLSLIVLNKTHINMDDDGITVSRQPLPNLFEPPRYINLDGVVAIRTEETPTSKKEAYDTPRYRVWAESEGGIRQTIVNDVTEEYAFFITQILEERLNDEANLDVSHLADDAPMMQSAQDSSPIKRQSQDNA